LVALIINPITDEDFAAYVHECARDAADPPALQLALRARYPRAVARLRELAGESQAVWYIYRDGRWVAPRDER
jgi:hypothetical protein